MSFASLSGQRIVVTGSSSGLGRAIALECARGGADVIVSCRTARDQASDVADAIRSLGRRADVLPVDIADAADRAQFTASCFDSGPVTGLVNNAGADLLTGPARSMSYSDRLQTLLAVDVTGTVELSRHFGQRFLEQANGGILNIGWDQSDRGMEGDSGELFATAKNAVMGFTRSLAVSLAPSVRVNCLAPGWVRTAWGEQASEYWQDRVRRETLLQRWGTPDDIAAMARFLLSDAAAWITGQVINVNGGAVR